MHKTTGTTPRYPVLLVDDEESWLHSFKAALRSSGLDNVELLSDSREVLAALDGKQYCAVAVDLMMPHISGEDLIPSIVESHPEVPVLVISGLNEIKTAVNCIRLGAFDFIVKTEDRNTLIAGIRHAIEIYELRHENNALRHNFFKPDLDRPELFSDIVTAHRDMRAVFQYIEAIAETDRPVIITGESGVGKELVAHAIHRASGRKGEFVAVNIAGLDDNVIADTLFGHRKGAYTGATDARIGLVEKAGNGTLFLDEIGDLSMASQTKLLRLLQEREYMPLGSDMAKKSSARVITATHQELVKMQNAGKFRNDLFYRLRGHTIHIPPLRKRHGDLPLLIAHFAGEAAASLKKSIRADVEDIASALSSYPFPGNVRELQHLIYDAVGICKGKRLTAENFKTLLPSTHIRIDAAQSHVRQEAPVSFGGTLPSLKEVRSKLINEALRRTNGNQSAAAQLIGITRQAVSKFLKENG